MDIVNQTVIKKYEYTQVNLVINSNGNKFIEKIQFHKPPVIPLTFRYDYYELEVIESIIKPLEIPHARIIESHKNDKCTTYVMEFIDGINCEDKPKAEYLYVAAEKIGVIYNKSKMNMNCLDRGIIEKYTLTKEKLFDYIKVINKYYNMAQIDPIINYVFEKYLNRTNFVTHGDIQFKNFIFNNDLHLIDWGGQIEPFFSDLHSLIEQAHRVGADIEEIKKRYLKFAQIGSISDEDILIGGIIKAIGAVFNLLIFDCPTEWLEDSYNELQDLISLLNFHL